MVECDYIMRLLQDFFAMLAKLVRLKVEEPDMTRVQERFNDMYKQFFRHSADHFYESEKEEILEVLAKDELSETEQHAMIQMLSELMYQDGLIKKDITEKCMLLEKSLFLMRYLERYSKTYSWDREQKMSDIHKMLMEYEVK